MSHITGTLRILSVTALLVFAADTAAAQPMTLASSLGQEFQFKPPPVGQARFTSLMISPGYQLNKLMRLEMGFSYGIDTYRRGKGDLEIRPALHIAPAGMSYYGRIHVGFGRLLTGETGESRPSVGGSIGQVINLGGVPLFVEFGLNPRTEKTKKDKFRLFWILEGRAGVTYTFE